jgi:hypothetical protein
MKAAVVAEQFVAAAVARLRRIRRSLAKRARARHI